MNKIKFNKVTIIGLGLMGGSLGLAVRKAGISRNVTGLGRNLKRLKMAKAKGAVHSVTIDVKEAVSGADLVVISLPVMLIPVSFKSIQPYLSKKTIVTDMGSVKGAIAEKIAKLDIGRNFIGSHPMVGSEKTGVENIRHGLYEKGTCIVAPGAGSDRKKAALTAGFWKSLGMKVISMDPKEHDRCLAGISHFPHLAAFALVNSQAEEITGNKDAVGPGFKDMTRIAASGEELWAEILLMNKGEITKNIKAYIKHLEYLGGLLENSRLAELKAYIKKSRLLREKF